ncbi:MAG: hypothetical protein H0U71_03020 [Gammaproteobacteria bacterium]|nr:hypothetical protein [Gammaproteobacteria bacterium]
MASTYARLFLGFSPPVSQQIVEDSRQPSSKSVDILDITILNQSQIDQALSHPQNKYLKEIISGPYVAFIRADRKIIQDKDSLEEQFPFVNVTLSDLEQKKKETKSEATKKVLSNIQSSLNQQWKYLQTINDSVNHQHSLLTETEASFKIVSKHNSDWQQYREKHLDKLRVELESLHIPEEEINNLLRQDLQYTIDKFTDRVIVTQDLPPAKLERLVKLDHPDFATYFKMKAYLAIRSVLPSSERTPQHMEKLEDFFKQAAHEAEQLHHQQTDEIKTLQIHKIEPILEVAQENHNILVRMSTDRLEQVKSVTNLEDINAKVEEAIQRAPASSMGPR